MNFSDRLKKIIKNIGLKRDEFAKLSGVSYPQLFRYLRDEQQPSITFLKTIKKQCPWVNLNWLVSGEGEISVDGSVVIEESTDQNKKIERLEKDIQEIKNLLTKGETRQTDFALVDNKNIDNSLKKKK